MSYLDDYYSIEAIDFDIKVFKAMIGRIYNQSKRLALAKIVEELKKEKKRRQTSYKVKVFNDNKWKEMWW